MVLRQLAKQVLINRGLGSRVATLNNPNQLNALTVSMVTRLRRFYEKWEDEGGVHVVILKGAGNAFCSGADVKELYKHGLEGKFDSCKEFFRELYCLNYLLGTYKKTQVSVVDGLAIGGACALNSYAEFQLASEKAAFASPETRIGFHPDAGSSFLLSCLKGSTGEYLALTGERLDSTDMIMTGLARSPVDSKKIHEIMHQLHALDTDDEDVIDHILDGFEEGVEIDADSFLHRTDAINRCFCREKVEDIIYALEAEAEGPDYAWYRDVIDNMRAASPVSQKIALKSIRMARQETLPECLKREYRLSCRVISGNISKDFYEGVRAHLLDKDHNPKWNPSYLELVSDDMVESYFKPFDDEIEELQLPLLEREGISCTVESSTEPSPVRETNIVFTKDDIDILNWAMGGAGKNAPKKY